MVTLSILVQLVSGFQRISEYLRISEYQYPSHRKIGFVLSPAQGAIYESTCYANGAAPAGSLNAVLHCLALVMAAQVTKMKGCSLCVVIDGGGQLQRPSELARGVPAVTLDWLMSAAEGWSAPPMRAYQLH